jgi:DNA polymerase (family 10)
VLLQREGFKLNLDEVYRVAGEEGVAIELNSHPHRLDLDWRELRSAKDRKVRFAINPDAHETRGYDDLRYGIGAARKGWLTKKDVINCLTADKAVAMLQARR